MNFDRLPPEPKMPQVKITINTIDTNLEYEMTMRPNEAREIISRLTRDCLHNSTFVKWIDTDDGSIHYINTNNIISIDVEEV